MVGYLPHCTFNLNPRAASIDTPLHAFVPRRARRPHAPRRDHRHRRLEELASELTQEIFGDEIGWLPWKRPGFELGLWLEKFCREQPAARRASCSKATACSPGATTRKECYETTLDIINQAIAWLDERDGGQAGLRRRGVASRCRRTSAARSPRALMPAIRGLISAGRAQGRPFRRPAGGAGIRQLARTCSRWRRSAPPAPTISCAPRSGRWWSTSIRRSPMSTRRSPASPAAIEAYRADYAAYYERCKHAGQPGRCATRTPVVYLVPGVGMITFARTRRRRASSAEFYVNAINVMRGASAVSTYRGPAGAGGLRHRVLAARGGEAAAHAEAEEPRRPHRLVTGGAGGIGTATAERLLPRAPASCSPTSTTTRSTGRSRRSRQALRQGRRARRRARRDRARRRSSAPSPRPRVEFGGIDILVSNAGIASSAPIEETTLSTVEPQHGHPRDRLFPGLARGVPAVQAPEARRHVVFVASKNGLAASPNASAYCTAKAAEIHLARCLALEGARAGIRVNVVNPDAVLRGSKIWAGEWREQRAAAYKTDDGGARGALPPALAAEAQRLSRGHRRGGLLPRLRHVGEVDRQHHQRRRRQRAGLHAVALPREDAMSEQRIIGSCRRRRQRRSAQRRLSATTTPSASSSPRRGIDIDAVTAKVARFAVAVPSWGVGTGGTRFARFPGPGEPRDIFDKLEDCAVIHQLTRATPTVSLHIPWDKVDDPRRLKARRRARPRLRRDELQHLLGRARPAALLQVRLAHPHRRRTRQQAVEHNSNASRSARRSAPRR